MNYAMCVTQEGKLFAWGNNAWQQSGTGLTKQAELKNPVEVTYFSQNGLRVTQVSCSKGEKHCHTMCVCDNGIAYSWGDQYKGQLGTLPVGTDWSHEVKKMQAQPKAIVGLPPGTAV